MVALKRGDAEGLAALYTENGQVMPPNSDFVTGRQAVQMFWQAVMDMGIKEAKNVGSVLRDPTVDYVCAKHSQGQTQ